MGASQFAAGEWDHGARTYRRRRSSAGGNRNFTGYTTEVITDLSLDWLKRRDRSKPSFLGVYGSAPRRRCPREWIGFDGK